MGCTFVPAFPTAIWQNSTATASWRSAPAVATDMCGTLKSRRCVPDPARLFVGQLIHPSDTQLIHRLTLRTHHCSRYLKGVDQTLPSEVVEEKNFVPVPVGAGDLHEARDVSLSPELPHIPVSGRFQVHRPSLQPARLPGCTERLRPGLVSASLTALTRQECQDN